VGSVLIMAGDFIFTGCSFTWGQGLWSYCTTKHKVPTVTEYIDGAGVPDAAIRFLERNRWPHIVAKAFKAREIIKRNNGGTDDESLRFINQVKENHVSKETLLTQNVEWDTVKLCVFQTTQLYRSSFYFNYKGEDYRVFSEPSKRNFDRIEKVQITDENGIELQYPIILEETKKFDVFINWLIDNNYSIEEFEKILIDTMCNRIKNKLKELEEKYNIQTLIVCWTDEYVEKILSDDWLSKRLVKIQHDKALPSDKNTIVTTEYNCIDDAMQYSPELIISKDNKNRLHPSGDDEHPSLECHKIIAESVVNKINENRKFLFYGNELS